MEEKKEEKAADSADACCHDHVGAAVGPSRAREAFKKVNTKSFWQGACAAVVLLFVAQAAFDVNFRPKFSFGGSGAKGASNASQSSDGSTASVASVADYETAVLPPSGVELPVRWGDLGKRMVDAGVIDSEKFQAIYAQRGGLSDKEKELLLGADNGNLKIDAENAGYLLNLLWALGLGNKNDILDNGPMTDERYGGNAGGFASTGGWTLAAGAAMDHYSKHSFMALTAEQQKLVERVSQNIYRPCCGNSTYFPDCNHGMAMLGLLELMASQGVSEEEMYRVALAVNSYWFPSTYLTIAKYKDGQGIAWGDVEPKEVLGAAYSSGSGYKKILSQVQPVTQSGGGGCGV